MLINVPVFLLCESFNYGKVIYGKFKACPKSDGKFPYEILIHPETKKFLISLVNNILNSDSG